MSLINVKHYLRVAQSGQSPRFGTEMFASSNPAAQTKFKIFQGIAEFGLARRLGRRDVGSSPTILTN